MKNIRFKKLAFIVLALIAVCMLNGQLIQFKKRNNCKKPVTQTDAKTPIVVYPTVWYLDADNDGYYIDVVSRINSPGANYKSSGIALGDCDDTDASVHESQVWYLDADNDGHYVSVQMACKSPGKGWKNQLTNYYNPEYNLGDCDDTDSSVVESQTWYLDVDNDGYYTDVKSSCKSPGNGWHLALNLNYYNIEYYGDCNDNDSLENRSHLWFLDKDNDGYYTSITQSCNKPGTGWHSSFDKTANNFYGYLNNLLTHYYDCDDNDPTIGHPVSWYLDHDNDGYASSITLSCLPPGSDWKLGGLVANDCNDFDSTIHECILNQPGGCWIATTVWILDADSDLHYTDMKLSCNKPGPGWYDPGINLNESHRGDCNDNDRDVYEIAYWYKDADNDRYYTGTPQLSCSSPGVGWKTAQIDGMLDCDDNDASVNVEKLWFLDADNDGYYTTIQKSCKRPGVGWVNTGFSYLLGDCDDNDSTIHERYWYKDFDGDGYYTSIAKACTSPGSGWKTTGNIFGDINDTDSLVWKSVMVFIDADGDGYHSGITTINIGNALPAGYSTTSLGYDCNDNNGSKNGNNILYLSNDISGCNSVNYAGVNYTSSTSIEVAIKGVDGCDSVDNVVKITLNANLAGNIKHPTSGAITKVTTTLSNGVSNSNTFTSGGNYQFNCLSPDSIYTIRPSKNNDSVKNNGVSVIDAILIQAHILAKTLLNSPYKIIAADVNNSGDVSTIDVLFIKRLALGIDTTFKGNRLWAFVDSTFQFSNATNPFPYKDSIVISNLTVNKSNQSFIGVKLGDVNYDWNATLLSINAKANNPIELYYNNINVSNEQEIRVPIKVKSFKNILGMQYTLNFNSKALELKGIEQNKLNVEYGTNRANEGKISFLWNDDKGIAKTLDDGSVLMELVFTKKASCTQEDLTLSNDIASIEAWDVNLQKHAIVKTSGSILQKQDVIIAKESWDVVPNPTTDGKVKVSINLQSAKELELKLTSIDGKLLMQQKLSGKKGLNTYSINLESQMKLAKGVYYLQANGLEGEKVKVIVIQ